MCTVVTRQHPGADLQVLAVRDEFVTREFDLPGEWWPDHPGVVGGRDRRAGGSWCVSDVADGLTALVLNRTERRSGTPSRGELPLAAIAHRAAWTEHVDHREMAAFTLVLASADAVTAWTWDAEQLRRQDLPPGLHVMTTGGVDAAEEKAERLTRTMAEQPWRAVVTAEPPRDDRAALVVRHEVEGDIYATVFGQLITAAPGRLHLEYSRTPWLAEGWTEQDLTA